MDDKTIVPEKEMLIPPAIFMKPEPWWKFWIWFKKRKRVAFTEPTRKIDEISKMDLDTSGKVLLCKECSNKVKKDAENLALGFVGKRKCSICEKEIDGQLGSYSYFRKEDVLNILPQKPQRHIDIVPIQAFPVQYFIWAEDKNNLAGYCLITIGEKPSKIIGAPSQKEAALWHIHVDKDYRRRGYGSDLINALKMHFDSIFTEALTDESRYMLKRHGFVREGKYYYWRRKKQDILNGSDNKVFGM